MGRMVSIGPDRRPDGYYTWVARLRDGTQLIEFEADQPPISFDFISSRDDVAEVCLIPYIPNDQRSHIRIVVGEGEWVKKVWTHTRDVDGTDVMPVIDTFVLISEKPVFHYCFHDGSIVITTNPEP